MTAGPSGLIGQVLDGRYRVLRHLGQGGMGDVYAAEHRNLERLFAVKVFRPHEGQHEGRFEREIRAMARIEHPHVVKIVDSGRTADGAPYLVMELVEGADLESLIVQRTQLPWREAIDIVRQIADGLAAAHYRGVVHRDVKPANVLLGRTHDGKRTVKLIDFGTARLSDFTAAVTSEGVVFGTPVYMSPEQIRGQEVDPRTDVYSTAVVLYELLTGRAPFEDPKPMEVFRQALSTTRAPRASQFAPDAEIPAALDQLLAWALEKDPTRRTPSMNAFIEVLDDIVTTTGERWDDRETSVYQPAA